MTVGELITLLEDYNEESEIQIAHQPNYPLRASILGTAQNEPGDVDHGDKDAVFIVAGASSNYASRTLWDEVGTIW